MPDDTGGPAFRDGSDHGGTDDEFGAVVFDEEFVRAAAVHEPTADERIAAAVESRMRDRPPGGYLPDARLLDGPGFAPPAEFPGSGFDGPRQLGEHPDAYREAVEAEYRDGARSAVRNHRMVAWVLAVVMGIGVLAMAVSAVYRSASTTPATRPVDSVPVDADHATPQPPRLESGTAAP